MAKLCSSRRDNEVAIDGSWRQCKKTLMHMVAIIVIMSYYQQWNNKNRALQSFLSLHVLHGAYESFKPKDGLKWNIMHE